MLSKDIYNFRNKKYNKIKIDYEVSNSYIKSSYYIFDSKTNSILIRFEDGRSGWILLNDFLSYKSWPLARTGVWPDITEKINFITFEEEKNIENNTVINNAK